MSAEYLSLNNLPFCKGCGHSLVMKAIGAALSGREELNPLDVVVVTDIGCIGIIDKEFNTHTVHGLHGRSVALASGIAMGSRRPKAKILVLLGDGGATIGLQHLLDAAHRNLNMTVIVHNNMLYGMTGGQPSSLTPCGYRTSIAPEGKSYPGVDLRSLVAAAGAPIATRILASPDMGNAISEALAFDGFSFIEVLELCTSHGTKLNPGKPLSSIAKEAGLEMGTLKNSHSLPPPNPSSAKTPNPPDSLLDREKRISVRHQLPETWKTLHGTARRKSIVLAGSAGEGVQTAAEILAQAAMSCGLHTSKKGSYPVTVGVGFSMAEVIISTSPIRYTGALVPDTVIVTSNDGLLKAKALMQSMSSGSIYIDKTCAAGETAQGVKTLSRPYRDLASAKSALLLAVMDYIAEEKEIPLAAFEAQAREHFGSKGNFDAVTAALGDLGKA
jgi:pyruvate/2-oxoacid:ferredoxin oxidoreductase beta subunit/Pyruvate/2-oxoacid:ferredoxin oxidoreductase gamma subunit